MPAYLAGSVAAVRSTTGGGSPADNNGKYPLLVANDPQGAAEIKPQPNPYVQARVLHERAVAIIAGPIGHAETSAHHSSVW